MALTLAALLHHASWGLRLIGPGGVATPASSIPRAGGPRAAGPGTRLDALTTPISSVAVTEAERPRPFLRGAELVLTTGARLGTVAAQRIFVRQTKQAGAVGIGFGIGLHHERIPEALLTEASRWGLAVVEVPEHTPFLALAISANESLRADQHTAQKQLLEAYRQVVESIPEPSAQEPDDADLAPFLQTLAALTLSGEPAEIASLGQELLSVARLQQAHQRRATRQLAGAALQEVVEDSLNEKPAAERWWTLRLEATELSVLAISVAPLNSTDAASSGSPLSSVDTAQLRMLQGLAWPAECTGCRTATTDTGLAVLIPASLGDPHPVAAAIARQLEDHGLKASLGLGSQHAGPQGLRWSYLEALEAARRGPGLNESEGSLTSALLSSADATLSALAERTLEPLVRFDAQHHSDLLPTLESYLELNGSLATCAQALSVHRNTVRYRLEKIAELSGLDPSVTEDRVQLWLALSVRRLDRGGGRNRPVQQRQQDHTEPQNG
ncbi:PucR family transcriptional regulator [Psychromicrobium xiongbiense]|uniref:PucR family transcriptional regulator n=1 Tax=Psychromicrobium xiongbiense TaxID=3051184 RepID=UPI002553D076|nr:PucR family transcriptional regulator [Psychromicrobium sp. YIM S02556]